MDEYNANNNYAPVQPQATLSTGQWVLTLFLSAIPCAGWILLLVWAFGNGDPNRKNYARAALIWWIVGTIISAIFYTTIIAAIMGSSGNY